MNGTCKHSCETGKTSMTCSLRLCFTGLNRFEPDKLFAAESETPLLFETYWNILKQFETIWNILKHIETTISCFPMSIQSRVFQLCLTGIKNTMKNRQCTATSCDHGFARCTACSSVISLSWTYFTKTNGREHMVKQYVKQRKRHQQTTKAVTVQSSGGKVLQECQNGGVKTVFTTHNLSHGALNA